MNQAFLGFLRGAGTAALAAVLIYAGDAGHLAFLGPKVSVLVAGIVLMLEHAIAENTGNALFGAVKA